MNLVFVWLAGWLAWMNRCYLQDHEIKMMRMEGGGRLKRAFVFLFMAILAGGAGRG